MVIGTAISLLAWALAASTVQVLIFERADRRWSGAGGGIDIDRAVLAPAAGGQVPAPAGERRRRFDPRAVIAAASVAFVLLLSGTSPAVLGAVAVWLAIAWLLAPAEREVVIAGLILTATLAVSAFVTNTIGGDGLEAGLEHAARGALLVLVATWMRGAAGTDGVRAVARRLLDRLRSSPTATELREALDSLAGERRMGAAARELTAVVGAAEDDLTKMLDATLDWIAAEAARFEPGAGELPPRLAYRPLDLLVVAGAVLPALALAG